MELKLLSHIDCIDGELLCDGEPLHLPNLDLESELGRGANGIVIRAIERPLNRTVAVKVWDARLEGDEPRALKEAQQLARCSHPGFIAVYSFGRVDMTAYCVMEYVEGQTLHRWLSAGDRATEEKYEVWRQYSEALEFIHDKDLTHGDPHTKNVIVVSESTDLTARLIDPGASRFPGRRRQPQDREPVVMLETAERLWEAENRVDRPSSPTLVLSATHDYNAMRRALDAYASYVRNFKGLELCDPDDGYGRRSAVFGMAIAVRKCAEFHVARVEQDLRSVVEPETAEKLVMEFREHLRSDIREL